MLHDSHAQRVWLGTKVPDPALKALSVRPDPGSYPLGTHLDGSQGHSPYQAGADPAGQLQLRPAFDTAQPGVDAMRGHHGNAFADRDSLR